MGTVWRPGRIMVERYRRIGEALTRPVLRRMVGIAAIALVVGCDAFRRERSYVLDAKNVIHDLRITQ